MMAKEPEKPRLRDIDIAGDLPFQRKEWIAERAGWLPMALVDLLSFLELFGREPVASASAARAIGSRRGSEAVGDRRREEAR